MENNTEFGGFVIFSCNTYVGRLCSQTRVVSCKDDQFVLQSLLWCILGCIINIIIIIIIIVIIIINMIPSMMYYFRVRSLAISDLRSEAKGSRFKSGC